MQEIKTISCFFKTGKLWCTASCKFNALRSWSWLLLPELRPHLHSSSMCLRKGVGSKIIIDHSGQSRNPHIIFLIVFFTNKNKERFPKSQYTFGQDKKAFGGFYSIAIYIPTWSCQREILSMIITHNFKD